MMLRPTLLSALLWALQLNQNVHSLVFTAPQTKSRPLFQSHVKTSPNKNAITLTYLEINCWLLSMGGTTILIDPLLEGPLDFGIPNLYQGTKRIIPSTGVTEALPSIDCILLTQGLDDHAHVRTLRKLRSLDPEIPVIAPPSAKGALRSSGFYDPKGRSSTIRFLSHRDQATITPRNNSQSKGSFVKVQATEGALVGPPWQKRENGYILRSNNNGPSLYIEPHVEFNPRELSRLGPVDVVISPVSGQTLPAFELVHGPKDTIRLLETLQPKYLVPMQNGDIETEGPVSKLVSELGSVKEFEERLAASKVGSTELVNVQPGKDLVISL